MSDSTANLRRLLVLSYGSPKINGDNWERMHKEGWSWHANIQVADYEAAHHFVKVLQEVNDKENVSVGAPWDIDISAPNGESASLCGIYVRDIAKIVRSLYHDLVNWEMLTQEQVDDL